MAAKELEKILELDKVIHERVRLGVMAALSVTDKMTFQDLKNTLHVTDGNLSVHLKSLEKHGYIKVEKRFVGRKPCSSYRLADEGKKAFQNYIRSLEKVIRQLPHE